MGDESGSDVVAEDSDVNGDTIALLLRKVREVVMTGRCEEYEGEVKELSPNVDQGADDDE